MLRYLALYALCDVTFSVLLVSWFITRHVLFIIVIKSAWVDSLRLFPELWAPERGNYISPLTHKIFSFLLVSLLVGWVYSSGCYVLTVVQSCFKSFGLR